MKTAKSLVVMGLAGMVFALPAFAQASSASSYGLPTPPAFPADVQQMVKQFKQDREVLVRQLKQASAEERARIIGDLQDLREQQKKQMQELRQRAREQGELMKARLKNNKMDRIIDEGSGSGSGKPGSKPRR